MFQNPSNEASKDKERRLLNIGETRGHLTDGDEHLRERERTLRKTVHRQKQQSVVVLLAHTQLLVLFFLDVNF